MTGNDEQLWRIDAIDQAFANGEMTEDELIDALLDALAVNREQDADTQFENRLRDFQAKYKAMQSPLIAALLSGNPLFEHFYLWKQGETFGSEPDDIAVEAHGLNFLTDSYDSEGNMLPPWQVFPDTPMTSMQWRLGSGASYLTVFGAWFQGLEQPAQQQYIEKYPVPESFRELYLFKDLL